MNLVKRWCFGFYLKIYSCMCLFYLWFCLVILKYTKCTRYRNFSVCFTLVRSHFYFFTLIYLSRGLDDGKIYTRPYYRMGPYLVGMYTGYLLYKTQCNHRMNKVRISKYHKHSGKVHNIYSSDNIYHTMFKPW